MGPHGPDMCSPDLVRKVRKTADELGRRIIIHMAQSQAELLFAGYGAFQPGSGMLIDVRQHGHEIDGTLHAKADSIDNRSAGL
jgi:hypothetical protein